LNRRVRGFKGSRDQLIKDLRRTIFKREELS